MRRFLRYAICRTALSCILYTMACNGNVAGTSGEDADVLAEGAVSIMSRGGCETVVIPSGEKAVLLRSPAADQVRWECKSISVDSMLALADAYNEGRRMNGTSTPYATAGHWEYSGYWREYCSVNMVSWVVNYCGVWIYHETSTWVPGETDQPPEGGGGGGGGGGDSDNSPVNPGYDEIPVDCLQGDDPTCFCPNSDPDCLLPLRSQDRVKIQNALGLVDQTNPLCKEGYDKIVALDAAGKLYRGNQNISDAPDAGHDAQTRPGSQGGSLGFVHVDEDYLDSSSLEGLGGVLLHEAWHLSGYVSHPAEELPPYTTYPYSQSQICMTP